MSRAIKPISLILTLITLCGALTACHGSRGMDAFVMPEAFDASRQYELTFWAKNDTNKNQTRIYEQAIRDFELLYPNIKINLRLYTDYGKIYNDVITNIATNTTPNICITYPDHIATYLTGTNVVAPLDELMADSRYGLGGSELRFTTPKTEQLVSKYLEECRIGEHYYALPFMRSTEACYINKDYVEKLGFTLPDTLTWDFIWQVAEAATEKNADGTYKVNSQKVMIPFIYKSTDNMMITLLRQCGAEYSDGEGNALMFNDQTKELLYTVAEHTKSGAFSTFKISGYPANFLNAGQCIFAIDSTAGSTWMGTDAPLSDISADKLVRFETAVRTVPQLDPDAPKMMSQGPSVCVFNKADSGEVLASWLFCQYLLTDGVQIAYSETEGYVPVTDTARSNADYLAYLSSNANDAEHYEVKLKAVNMLLENVDNTFTTPVYNGSASLRDAAGQLIENTAKSVRRRETIDDAYMQKLFADVISLYRLDNANAASAGGKEELGPLPASSRALIWGLCAVWALIIAYAAYGKAKQKRRKRD